MRRLTGLPPLVLLGLVLLLSGAVGDLVFHTAPALGLDGARAHLLTLAGMVTVLAGVLERARRS